MALWQAIAAKGDPLAVYRELCSLYSQSHRHYHNLCHVAECLAEFYAARSLAREPMAVELALWFHDAVYDTKAHDNEEKSAELARRHLSEAGARADLCAAVTSLVMATKQHDPSLHPDAPLVVDVDLSILGRPQARFDEYESQIRREYDWVAAATFAAKRAEILERFLARERIYSTEPFFRKYEETARVNLCRSLEQLRRSSYAH
jgi:predicted metal-dependent HD superfamily phosphohydrolase